MTTTRTYSYTDLHINGNLAIDPGQAISLSGNTFRLNVSTNVAVFFPDLGLTYAEKGLLTDYEVIWDFSKMSDDAIARLKTAVNATTLDSTSYLIKWVADNATLKAETTIPFTYFIKAIETKGYVKLKVISTATTITSSVMTAGIEDLTWKLRINKKNVKAIHSADGKQYKQFTINGHTFNFDTELIPPKPASTIWYADADGKIYQDGALKFTVDYSKLWTSARSVSVKSVYMLGSDVYILLANTNSSLKYALLKNDKYIGYMTKSDVDVDANIIHIDDTKIYFGGSKIWYATLADFTGSSVTPHLIEGSNSGQNAYFFDNRIWYSELTSRHSGNLRYIDLSNNTAHQYGPDDMIGWGAAGNQMLLGKTATDEYFGISAGKSGTTAGSIRMFKGTTNKGVDSLSIQNYTVGSGYYVNKVSETKYTLYIWNGSDLVSYDLDFEAMTFKPKQLLGIAGTVYEDFSATNGVLTGYTIDNKFYIATTDKKIVEYDLTAKTRTVKWTTEGSNPAVDWTGMRG